jgi:mRNA deadenylase 3'-5' endonuclease subunit Ccr4
MGSSGDASHEPETTNVTPTFTGCLDYIFVSGAPDAGLRVTDVVRVVFV